MNEITAAPPHRVTTPTSGGGGNDDDPMVLTYEPLAGRTAAAVVPSSSDSSPVPGLLGAHSDAGSSHNSHSNHSSSAPDLVLSHSRSEPGAFASLDGGGGPTGGGGLLGGGIEGGEGGGPSTIASSSSAWLQSTTALLLDPAPSSSSSLSVPRVVSTLLPPTTTSAHSPSLSPSAYSSPIDPLMGGGGSGSNADLVTAAAAASPNTSPTSPTSKPAATRRRHTPAKPSKGGGPGGEAGATTTTASNGGGGSDPALQRRQKRLERNRESARLSRRRRKQYLEVLEARVTEYSHDMDLGRRAHVANAVTAIQTQRQQLLVLLLGQSGEAAGSGSGIHNLSDTDVAVRVRQLYTNLSRTSPELMVATTFRSQQLKSFALPPESKFVAWLTLQSDAYFRGGRAASERLSAARIGERVRCQIMEWSFSCTFLLWSDFFFVLRLLPPFRSCARAMGVQILNSGTDRVAPSQSMWPLLCSEIGLSYEQEEKVRSSQRILLQNSDTWVDRHTIHAANQALDAVHDALQAVTLRLGQRETSTLGTILTPHQQVRFLAWTNQNRHRLPVPSPPTTTTTKTYGDPQYQTSDSHHPAANLYILHHKLQAILQTIPRAAPLVTGSTLKKLSRRPSFESLGCIDRDDEPMSRDRSFSSAGSLKRSASEMTMDADASSASGGGGGPGGGGDDKTHVPPISPPDAQEAARPTVQRILGHVQAIIPPPPTVTTTMAFNPLLDLPLPAPTPIGSMVSASAASPSHPGATLTLQASAASAPQLHHQRKPSFLPAHLNLVPEDLVWGADDGTGLGADDFLMNLVDEDWAIGEGIDMELDATA